ncbi:MAG: hypothetical protein J6D26_03880 [Clostridia bacterium]|nr:hypothetical protein [Clostridia bacterium]
MKGKRILSIVLAVAMILSTMGTVAFAAEDTDIYSIGEGKTYATLAEASAVVADTDNDGAITYQIYGKLDISDRGWLNFRGNSGATTINFVGMDEAAEISLTHDSSDNWTQIMGTDNIKMNAINYSNLTLSKPNGKYVGDAAHQNRMFTTWMRGASTSATVTYTGCVFPNGAGNNQYGRTVYDDCDMYSEDYYALWIYDAGDNLRADGTPASVEVKNCDLVADRGVKIYSEEQNGTAACNTTITNCTFDIESKPAVVSSLDGTITMTDVNYDACEYGLLETGYLNGNPKYALANVTVDGEAPKYIASVTSTNQWGGTSTVYVTDNDYAELVADESYEEATVVAPAAMISNENGSKIYDSVQNAINAAAEGDSTITLLADFSGDVTVSQQEGINITLDGNGKTFSGTIYLDGNSRHTGAETLNITGFNFNVDAVEDHDFISANSTNGEDRYAHNVTVSDCTFTATGNTDEFDVVAMRYRQTYNMNVNNCTFTNLHSAMWATAVSNGLVFDTITVENCKNGISVGTSLDVYVINSEIKATAEGGYGIRADGDGARNLYAEGTSIEAYYPVIVRKANNAEFALTIEEGCDFSASNPAGYDIAVTSGSDDAALVKPENDIKITIDETVDANVFSSHEASINGVLYKTLANAIAVGGEIILLGDVELNTKLNNQTINIDLDGHTMNVKVGANYLVGNNKISNGTVDITGASSTQNIFGLAQYNNAATTMTMDNVNFIGDGYNSGYAVFEIGNSGADVALTIMNSTIDLKNDNADQGGFVKGNSSDDTFILNNTTVKLDNVDMFVVNVKADFDNSNVKAENLTATAFRNFGGTVNNTIISVSNAENGIRNSSADYKLDISDNSSVKIDGSTNTEEGKIGDLVLAAGCKVTVDSTSELLVETSTIADSNDVDGNIISKADTVYVQYKKTDLDTAGKDNLEGSDTYEIVLAGADAEKINELASADLTFDFVGTPFDNANMSYTVTAAKGVTLTQIGDRYMFNYNGVDKYEESGTAIVIGTITVNGYGRYTLGTKDADTNAVYATEIRDSIVDGFEAAADLVINSDMVENDGMVGNIDETEIKVPVRDLTIDIEFNNAVNDNVAAYQDMTVTVSGGDLTADKVIKLGTAPVLENTKAAVTYADGYEIVLADELTLNTTYVVTVTGAGYRTARATVTMTEDKAVTFWNNVKDVEGANYLAGDIVKDNTINLYDLSAVVSYFGTNNTVTAKSDYAKYDLNRDGKIDSKDVAYVLVSWGK